MAIYTNNEGNYHLKQRGYLVSGDYFKANSRFVFPPKDHPNSLEREIEINIGHAKPYDDDEVPLYIPRMPVKFIMIETIGNMIFYDEYEFADNELDSHKYAEMTKEDYKFHKKNGLWHLLKEDLNDEKIFERGILISETLKKFSIPARLIENPIIKSLVNNNYNEECLKKQLDIRCLDVAGYKEIPVAGLIFENFYENWIFPPKDEPGSVSRDLKLRIILTNPKTDADILTNLILPTIIELTEYSESFNGYKYIDRYAFRDGRKLKHRWDKIKINKLKRESVENGSDMRFIKLLRCKNPLMEMLEKNLPYEMAIEPTIKELRDGRFLKLPNEIKEDAA